MGKADVIDVAAFHEHDFAFHLFPRDSVSRRRIRFVTVHTLQLDRLTVDVEVATGQSKFVVTGFRVAYLDRAYAEIRRGAIHQTAFPVLQFGHENVAIGRFCTPELGFPDVDKRLRQRRLSAEDRRHFDRDAAHRVGRCVAIQHYRIDTIGQRHASLDDACEVTQASVNADNGSLSKLRGADCQVAYLHLWHGGEVGAAENARQSEHILRFEEGAVAVSVNLHGHRVLAFPKVGSDVKACRVAAVLAESDVMAVDPKVEEAVHAVEIKHHLTALPVGRKSEGTAVGTHFVALEIGCPALVLGFSHYATAPIVLLHFMIEDDGLVNVDGYAVLHLAPWTETLHVPASRDAYVVP